MPRSLPRTSRRNAVLLAVLLEGIALGTSRCSTAPIPIVWLPSDVSADDDEGEAVSGRRSAGLKNFLAPTHDRRTD